MYHLALIPVFRRTHHSRLSPANHKAGRPIRQTPLRLAPTDCRWDKGVRCDWTIAKLGGKSGRPLIHQILSSCALSPRECAVTSQSQRSGTNQTIWPPDLFKLHASGILAHKTALRLVKHKAARPIRQIVSLLRWMTVGEICPNKVSQAVSNNNLSRAVEFRDQARLRLHPLASGGW